MKKFRQTRASAEPKKIHNIFPTRLLDESTAIGTHHSFDLQMSFGYHVLVLQANNSIFTNPRHAPPFQAMNDSLLSRSGIVEDPNAMNPSSYVNYIEDLNKRRKLTRRSHSAPCVFTDTREPFDDLVGPRPGLISTPTIVQQALVGIALYMVAGIIVFMFTIGGFKGNSSSLQIIDALYFIVVTLCTIGYGDIVPDTTFTKLFTSFYILIGFGIIGILLHGLVTYICHRQEAVMLSTVDENRFNTMVLTYMVDKEKGRMRIRIKVCLALAVVTGCIAIGAIAAHYIEGLSWVDSFFLSVNSVTTVGYGDYSFSTTRGRAFAIVWLLVSTYAVARAFLYLAELRIYKRNRRITKWVLKRKITLGDLVAADLDNDGSISKSEFVLYKLKEMGKITEKDIQQISNHFDSFEHSNSGKITVADLMDND